MYSNFVQISESFACSFSSHSRSFPVLVPFFFSILFSSFILSKKDGEEVDKRQGSKVLVNESDC